MTSLFIGLAAFFYAALVVGILRLFRVTDDESDE